MPNIEIHSLPEQQALLRARIFALFQNTSYRDEIVVTVYPTEAMDRMSTNQPFIRLVTTPQDNTEEIITTLLTQGLDVEHLQLTAFHPAIKQER